MQEIVAKTNRISILGTIIFEDSWLPESSKLKKNSMLYFGEPL